MLTDNKPENKSPKKGKTALKTKVSASSVRTYLKNNKDFFVKPSNKKLLESIKIPHYSGCSISLLEYQIKTFREQRDSVYNQLDHVIEINKANQKILNVFMQLVHNLVECESPASLVKVFSRCWKDSLDVDDVSMMLSDPTLHDSLCHSDTGVSKDVTFIKLDKKRLSKKISLAAKTKKVLCLRVDEDSQNFFSKKLLSGSFAFVPSGNKDQLCYVFLGSKSAEKFSPEMQPDMVSFVCDVFSGLLYNQHRLTTKKKG